MTFYEPSIPAERVGTEPRATVSLRKQISEWCRAKKPTAQLITITPEMASLMMERNLDTNRNKSSTVIANYKREISDERMMVTNQGIGFDTDGRMIDGQHRLMACIASGQPFQSWVMFGLDPRAFLYVDSGYKRTAGHKAGIAGFPDPNNLAAAARIVLIDELSEIDLANTALGVTAKGREKIPDDFVVDFLRENPKFVELKKWHTVYNRFKPLSRSVLHAAHWMIGQKHPRLAESFINQLCLGEHLSAAENVYRLRDHLNNLHLSRDKMSKSWQLAWIIDAFNDTRRGKTTKFNITRRDFPKVLS